MKEILALIASILAIVGYWPYLRKTIANKVKPHPYTWFVWSIVSGITFAGQLSKGAGIGALSTSVAEVLTILIFIFSIRNGFSQIKKTDTYYLIAAILGLIPWIILKDPTISVIIAVLIDMVAFVPTLRKSEDNPETESRALYFTNVIRHFFTIGSLRTYNIATLLHSIVMIIMNSLMTYILRNKKSPKAK